MLTTLLTLYTRCGVRVSAWTVGSIVVSRSYNERSLVPCPPCRHFRRSLLEALNRPLEAELDFIDVMAENSPKNYQLWYAIVYYSALLLSLSLMAHHLDG